MFVQRRQTISHQVTPGGSSSPLLKQALLEHLPSDPIGLSLILKPPKELPRNLAHNIDAIPLIESSRSFSLPEWSTFLQQRGTVPPGLAWSRTSSRQRHRPIPSLVLLHAADRPLDFSLVGFSNPPWAASHPPAMSGHAFLKTREAAFILPHALLLVLLRTGHR